MSGRSLRLHRRSGPEFPGWVTGAHALYREPARGENCERSTRYQYRADADGPTEHLARWLVWALALVPVYAGEETKHLQYRTPRPGDRARRGHHHGSTASDRAKAPTHQYGSAAGAHHRWRGGRRRKAGPRCYTRLLIPGRPAAPAGGTLTRLGIRTIPRARRPHTLRGRRAPASQPVVHSLAFIRWLM